MLNIRRDAPPQKLIEEGGVSRWQMLFVWLSRMNCCRGFGIQSPSAYAFVRYVINEHYPYYAYSDETLRSLAVNHAHLHLLQFYFRLSNSVRKNWLDLRQQPSDAVRSFVTAGFRHCQFITHAPLATGTPYSISGIGVITIGASVADKVDASCLLQFVDKHSYVVVEDIGRSPASFRLWKELLALGRSRYICSYDLYYCGVIFTDSGRYSRHYRVNF